MRERQTIISFLIRGFTLLLISAASSWAVDIDMPISASADCLKNNYMSLDLKYHHGPAKCHKTEGIWTGDFLNTSQAEVCRPPEPLSTSIGQCNNTCCYICGGNDETHRNPLNNFAKPAIPGVYRQSISLTSLEEGKSITADVRVVFTPDGLGGLPVCASAQTAVNIPSEGSESANFIITIPDEGQGPCPASTNINLEGGSDATVLIGGPDVSLQVRMADENNDPLGMSPVTFSIAGDSRDTKFADGSASVVAFADGDGIATAMLKPGTQEAEFGVTFNGGRIGCDGSPLPLSFNVTVREPQPHIYLLPGAESGDGQRELAGTELPRPLRVIVKDKLGVEQNGVEINFSIISGPIGGSFSNPNQTTGPDGIASTRFTLGSAGSNYTLRAFCSACSTNPGNEVLLSETPDPTASKSRQGDKGQGSGDHGPDQCHACIVPGDSPPGNCASLDNPPLLACSGGTDVNIRNEVLFLSGRSDLLDLSRSCEWEFPLSLESIAHDPGDCEIAIRPKGLTPGTGSDLEVSVSHPAAATCQARRTILAAKDTVPDFSFATPLGGGSMQYGSRATLFFTVDPGQSVTDLAAHLRTLIKTGALSVTTALVSAGAPEDDPGTPYGKLSNTMSVQGSRIAVKLCLPCIDQIPPLWTQLRLRHRICEVTSAIVPEDINMLGPICLSENEQCEGF